MPLFRRKKNNPQSTHAARREPFWSLSVARVETALKTNRETGLSESDVVLRQKKFGPNVMEESHQSSRLKVVLNQCKSPLILMLLFAGVVTVVIGHYRDSLFIFFAISVNVLLGYYQEYKAERALAELKTYLKQRSRVIRGGVERDVDARDVVPGDVIRLAQGDRVPADARLTFVNDLEIDEAILTGESLPVAKTANPVREDAGLGDQRSMAFAGTLVTQGVATAMVCRTAFGTELGSIAALVAETRAEATPLQAAIKKFSIQVSVFLCFFTLLVFVLGVASGHSYIDMFLIAVAIAISAVPEGLPVAMTVIMAVGVQRMAERKGVIRKLVAAEALGSTTVILTDKTGTLTMANMAMSRVVPAKAGEETRLLSLALLNTTVLNENPHDAPAAWRLNGRVVETALVRGAGERGILAEKIKHEKTIVQTLPFNAVNKFSVSLIRDDGKDYLVFLGAADILAPHTTYSKSEQDSLLSQVDDFARTGELVVGVATKKVALKKDFSFATDLDVSELTFEGLITLRDPVRPNVAEALRRVEKAGIKTVIMTGDHRGTAEAVAKELGITLGPDSVLEAKELRDLSAIALKKILPEIRIIARVSPLDKMNIAKAFQELGEVVAMTGDGVNDAPSIKQADVGIAMGSGTEVARDVADLVLLDDNFETIVAAVEEGRQIMHNIKKVLVYLLSSVTDGLLLIGGALLFDLPLPLNALQILWVNFFSDSFPAIAFAFEKNVDGLTHAPRRKNAGLFDPLMKWLVLYIGLSTSAMLFGLYWLLLRAGFAEELVRTFIFASFGTYSLFLAFSVRSLQKSIFAYSPFSNSYMIAGTGIGIVLMAAAVYVPFLQTLFDTVALPFIWCLGVVAVGIFNMAAIEAGKWWWRRRA